MICFFVLSGFLITRILLAARSPDHYFRVFYWRRSLRIFPAYFLYLVLAFLFLAWQQGSIKEILQPTRLTYWVYLQNWIISLRGYDTFRAISHLWSLAIEEQFYLLWPFLVLWVEPKKLFKVTVLAIAIAMIARTVLIARESYVIGTYVSTVTRMDTLAAGAMIALASQNADWQRWLSQHAARLTLAGLTGMIVILLWRGGYEIRDWAVRLFGFTANIVFCAGLIAMAAFDTNQSRLVRIFSLAGLRRIGSRSYAAYLIHWPVTLVTANYIQQRGGGGIWAILITLITVLVLTLFAAEISWHAYEKQWLKLRD